MTQVGTTKHDPIPIGEVAKPPFARSPDPLAMFARRAERLRVLANGHELRTYLMFLADLCDVQHRLQPGLPDAELPPADAIARSRQFRMPPLDRIRFERDGAMDAAWKRLLAMVEQVAMPDKARHRPCALESGRSRRRNDFDWRRSGERNTARGTGRARVRGRSIAGALRPFCGAPRCRSAGAGRSRRLSRLWRSAGVHHGGRLERSARDPLLRLLAVRDALELSTHQMRFMRLDEGHCVSRD